MDLGSNVEIITSPAWICKHITSCPISPSSILHSVSKTFPCCHHLPLPIYLHLHFLMPLFLHTASPIPFPSISDDHFSILPFAIPILFSSRSQDNIVEVEITVNPKYHKHFIQRRGQVGCCYVKLPCQVYAHITPALFVT